MKFRDSSWSDGGDGSWPSGQRKISRKGGLEIFLKRKLSRKRSPPSGVPRLGGGGGDLFLESFLLHVQTNPV